MIFFGDVVSLGVGSDVDAGFVGGVLLEAGSHYWAGLGGGVVEKGGLGGGAGGTLWLLVIYHV